MFDSNNLYLFFIASIMLNLTPGNDMLFVISRSLSQGFKAGVFSAIGIFIGCLVHIFAALVGLSYIIAKSAFLFELIKYAGAAYLLYLGISSLFSRSKKEKKVDTIEEVNKWKLLKQGIITNALNPKVAVFFLSFLPQFINISAGTVKLQLLTLGLWFDLQGTFVLLIVAFLVGRTSNFIKNNPKIWAVQEKLTGAILVGLGIKLALSKRN